MVKTNRHSLVSKKCKGKVVLFFPTCKGEDERDNWMPFPYLYLAPFIEKAGFEVCIIDSRVEPTWEEMLKKELKESFALGITSMSGPDLISATRASQIARDMDNDICLM